MSSGLLQNSKGAPSEGGIGEYFFSPQHEFVQKKHPSILIVDSFVRLLRHDMSWQVDIRSHQLLIGTRLRSAQKKKLDEFLNKKIYNLTISTTETSSSSSLGQIHVQHSFDYPIARSRWPSQQTYIRSGSTDESFVIEGSQSDIFFAQEYTLESSSSDTMSTLSTLNHLIPTPRHASCSHLIPTPNEATSASCSFNFDSFGADMFKSVTQTMSQKRQNYSGVNDEESDSSDDDSSFRDYD
jgi:hypothetical protein